MKASEHALKRLQLITGDSRSKQEIEFMHKFLLPGQYTIKWKQGILAKDFLLFVDRCERFGVKILGIETSFDSPNPLYCYTWEGYSDAYLADWYLIPLIELVKNGVEGMIIPTIDVPKSILKLYL